ncbi:nitrate/nitrite two-component system sensor histidine kinase [Pseudomonas sp. AFG_SD02_1510_Pfu_092]|uniref:histidine kinase n=1 Tax=Pseudomonas sp. AFG_SD02_1510_Pfu_092 TaxID=2259497 RepID=UPI000DEFDB95|nr:histidine kinase [Pseudomonas sp. AFG_SD02_1510_Pfu_092]RCL27497.1 nitrate/nitrite two-component system sensor histidine kinase [Pseudomonas sp. AFG_SD02_1510_Pfu_092]
MLSWLKSSLPARAGLAVVLLAALSLASTFSAVMIARVSENDAAAMNTAGSLRMATYRLDWQLEANAAPALLDQLRDDMQQRLQSPTLAHMLDDGDHSPVGKAFAQVLGQWQTHLLPALQANDKQRFQQEAERFVEHLEDFVLQLQKQSERRQGWQQNIQGAALLITVVILLIGLYELNSGVIAPLQELVRTTERFRAGKLDARIRHRSSDELGQMADSFNAMADAIEQSHRTLASRVAEKTQELEQSNAALDLLCHASRSIATQPTSAEHLDELISSFQQRLPGLRLSLCLHGENAAGHAQLIALHGDDGTRDVCAPGDCHSCQRQFLANRFSLPVSSQGVLLGDLRAYFLDGHAAHAWERELIQALADLIGTSLSLERQRERENRLLLLDERNTIARELHDSLAQALSYMKLQVSRLQTLIRRGENTETLLAVSDELRTGLNNGYRQLRELLTTFRLQIQDGGLEQALEDTAHEFAERGNMRVRLQQQPLAFTLGANEQIHVLQIAREALSNCARHAKASEAWVYLRQDGELIELLVEDDGIGLQPDYDGRQHHGLNIMQERARSLGGQLSLAPRAPQGTQVRLRFAPGFLRQPETETPT